jgi:uncharacterized membrane protein (DUF2068 family)
MPWLGIRGNGTLSHALSRKFRLVLRKRWAEYFTIVTTTGLIPLEVIELARHFTMTKLVITFVNVLIVLYLVARVRSH